MANTKLKKKKKGVVGANGLNYDAGTVEERIISFWSYFCFISFQQRWFGLFFLINQRNSTLCINLLKRASVLDNTWRGKI